MCYLGSYQWVCLEAYRFCERARQLSEVRLATEGGGTRRHIMPHQLQRAAKLADPAYARLFANYGGTPPPYEKILGGERCPLVKLPISLHKILYATS